jgi:hypothetical protein
MKVYEGETPWPESLSELHPPSDSRLSAKLLPTYVVSVTDPYGRILGFLGRRYMIDILNVTVWRVLRKRLHLKAYQLFSILNDGWFVRL